MIGGLVEISIRVNNRIFFEITHCNQGSLEDAGLTKTQPILSKLLIS